uniref:Glycerophosphocholine acyltransferase 1 n=1 Tax=Angiostrongylus cantonensis TaxID=6313 RepID=A0A0K0DMF5_ANGCA
MVFEFLKEINVSNRRESQLAVSPPPTGAISVLSNMLDSVFGEIGGMMAKGKAIQMKMRANKVVPFASKVQPRHLELEPLCCLSSCLVRGGCTAVVAFEVFYVLATLLIVIGSMSVGGFKLWMPLPQTFNPWFRHHLFYYFIIVYDMVLVRVHYPFCYVSLLVNLGFLVFSVWTLSSSGPYTWTPTNCLLVLCFAMQIPLQIWAITVVKSCQDFFSLIHVFITMAEA